MAKCLYCHGGPISREHVFADWLRRFIPNEMPRHNRLVAVAHLDRTDFEIKRREGDLHSWKVKCACRRCNGGWMSVLQERAKIVVTPLILGESATLDAQHQRTLSAWVAMAVIAGDAAGRYGCAISQGDRDYVYRNHVAPFSWSIWLGRRAPTPPVLWSRRPFAVIKEAGGRTPGLDRPDYNSQTVTFAIGALFVHAIIMAAPLFIDRWRAPTRIAGKLRQIAPAQGGDIVWPPAPLEEAEAEWVRASLFDAIMEAARRAEARQSGSD
jgi:hypothetical protein